MKEDSNRDSDFPDGENPDSEIALQAADLLRIALTAGGPGGRPEEAMEGQVLGGRYRIVSLLGEGGFGEVYRAEQIAPVKRDVAVKILKGEVRRDEARARFEGERQALARMSHAHIAKFFDAGVSEGGRLYFVMEFVSGDSITRYCHKKAVDLRGRLEMFRKVCDAVQHAHQRGVIHRDLKPSNILVEDQDGVGVPKVIDFGIAKAMSPEVGDSLFVTRSEALMGTPAYMSPEQAELGAAVVDTRSDVYSLGVILNELLTGSLPHELTGKSHHQVRQTIIDDDPIPPSVRVRMNQGRSSKAVAKKLSLKLDQLSRSLRGDLDAIVLQALERERNDRYSSPLDLSLDVDSYLNDRPVMARSLGLGYRVVKLVKRRKQRALAAVAVLGLVCAAGVMAFFRAQDRERQIGATLAAGTRALERDDLLGALVPYVSAMDLERSDSRAQRTHRHRVGLIMNSLPRLGQMWFPGVSVTKVAVAPSGEEVAVGCEDSLVRVYRMGEDEPRVTLPHEAGKVFDLKYSSDGRFLVVGYAPSDMVVWRVETGSKEKVIETDDKITSLTFLDGDDRLILGTLRSGLYPNLLVGNWREDAVFSEIPLGEDTTYPNVNSLGIGAVGENPIVIAAPVEGPIHFLDGETLEPKGELREPWLGWKGNLGVHPNLPEFAFAMERSVRLVNLETLEEFDSVEHEHHVSSVSYSPDGRFLVTSGLDKTVRVWGRNETDGNVEYRLVCAPIRHGSETQSSTFAPDSRRLVVGTDSGIVSVWDLAPINWAVDNLASRLTKNGKYLFSQTGDELVISRLEGSIVERIEGDIAASEVYVSADEQRFLICGPTAEKGAESPLTIRVLARQAGQLVPLLNRELEAEASILAVDPGIERVVYSLTNDDQAVLSLLDVNGGETVRSVLSREQGASEYHRPFEQPKSRFHGIRGVFFDPVNESAIFCFTAAKVFHGVIGEPLDFYGEAENPGYRSSFVISHISLAPDNRTLIVSVTDNGLTDLWAEVWDFETGEPTGARLRHQDGVVHSEFGPEGKLLATASEDGYVKIWNWDRGRYTLRFAIENENDVQRVTFSSGGRWVAAVMSDRVQLWDLERGTPLGPGVMRLWGGNQSIAGAMFAPDDSALLVQRERGDVVSLSLIPEERTLKALLPLVELLSSQRNDPRYGLQPLETTEMEALWKAVSKDYPEVFEVSEQELDRWNRDR